jgi:hypothetical protein
MSKLLFDEQPLVIDKTLAKLIGLNECIVIQQIHYWLTINQKTNKNYNDGCYWTYNTINEWQEEFPFWSVDTVKRTLAKLRKRNILITGNYNKLKRDRTLWYTINYAELKRLAEEQKSNENNVNDDGEEDLNIVFNKKVQEKIQNELLSNNREEDSTTLQKCNIQQCNSADCTFAKVQNAPMNKCKMHSPLPEITTEITNIDLHPSIYPSSNTIVESNNNINVMYEQVINNCYIDELDTDYKSAVIKIIKDFFKDIENKKRINIGDNSIPVHILKDDINKLNHEIIVHAINNFEQASREKKIKKPLAYLRTCIYNSIHEVDIDIKSDCLSLGLI